MSFFRRKSPRKALPPGPGEIDSFFRDEFKSAFEIKLESFLTYFTPFYIKFWTCFRNEELSPNLNNIFELSDQNRIGMSGQLYSFDFLNIPHPRTHHTFLHG